MTRNCKIRIKAAIDKLQGLPERNQEELEGELDYEHQLGREMGFSVSMVLMADYLALVKEKGEDGGFKYGGGNNYVLGTERGGWRFGKILGDRKKSKGTKARGTGNNSLEFRI